jgi:small subunit ribosomal protein S16
LARRGRKNLNAFAIVTAEQKFRRDGRFVEKIGYYQPTLKSDDEFRLKIDQARYEHWVSQGAQASDKVKKLAFQLGFEASVNIPTRPKKSLPKKKAQERAAKLNQAAE